MGVHYEWFRDFSEKNGYQGPPSDKSLEDVIAYLISSACGASNTYRPWQDNDYGRAAQLLARSFDDERHPDRKGIWEGRDK